MLRFPYLLILLLFIELSFCYIYIDEVTEHKNNKLKRNLRRGKARSARRPNLWKIPNRQEDYDRRKIEFDVASFIQPDEDNLEADEALMRHETNKRSWTQKSFESDDRNKKMDKTPDYMSIGSNQNLMSPKHFGYNALDDLNSGKYGQEKFRNIHKDDVLMNQNAVHSHEKKCSSLKSIKFPFFSHNKSESLKPKKTKKRKLFFFNNSKKAAAKVDNKKMNDDTMIPYKMKRSYEQRLCPACKKVFLANMEHDRSKKNPSKIIHNSRQFYQNSLPDATLKEDFRTNKISNSDDGYRNKREYDTDKNRQLKELDEVQRKIEAVEISLPHFERPAK